MKVVRVVDLDPTGAAAGAAVWLIDGLINDCRKIVADGKEEMGWFDLSTLKEPYRIEGKKTMGLEPVP
mgnify:CR=1 FL=1